MENLLVFNKIEVLLHAILPKVDPICHCYLNSDHVTYKIYDIFKLTIENNIQGYKSKLTKGCINYK